MVDSNGMVTNAWYRFFDAFLKNTITATDLAILMSQVETLNSLVSQLVAQSREQQQVLLNLQQPNTDLDDVKRRLRTLEQLASLRMH